MGATATVRKSDFIDAMEENQKDVRKMVMDSYHDIEKGKGRDYKEFFAELESRYRNESVAVLSGKQNQWRNENVLGLWTRPERHYDYRTGTTPGS